MRDPVVIGKFGRPHGVRGELRFWPHNPDSSVLAEGRVVGVEGAPDDASTHVVEKARAAAKFWIVKLEGVDDRDEAAAFRNREVYVSRDVLPELDDDEYYHADLVGLAVLGHQSASDPVVEIGAVAGFLDAVDTDVMVVEGARVDGRLLVPMLAAVVLDVDLEAESVTLAPLDAWAPVDERLVP